MDIKHNPGIYTPSRRWWQLFTRTIWLIGLFGAGTLGVVGWSIYHKQYPGVPVLKDKESVSGTLVTNDSINRYDSRERVLVRDHHPTATQPPVTPVFVH